MSLEAYNEIVRELSVIPLELLTEEDCRGVHNFSIPTLQTYFSLEEMRQHVKKPILTREKILFLPSPYGRYKSYCFQPIREETLPLISKLRKLGPVYSIDQIVGMSGETKFREVGYDLDKVFDPASYANAKKRHQRIVYPLKQIEKLGIIEKPSTFEEVKELHDEWARRKLEDPNTFKMMFPNRRYLDCYAKAIGPNFKTFTFYMDSKLIAVRVLGIQKDLVVDLANFGRVWEMPSNTMNYLDTWVLKKLHSEGFKKFNCGSGLNKSLTAFKKHYPNFDVISYAYSKVKPAGEVK